MPARLRCSFLRGVPISALCAVSALPVICALAVALCAFRTSSTSCTWDKFVHLEPNHFVVEDTLDWGPSVILQENGLLVTLEIKRVQLKACFGQRLRGWAKSVRIASTWAKVASQK
jgi:hypothetical protein